MSEYRFRGRLHASQRRAMTIWYRFMAALSISSHIQIHTESCIKTCHVASRRRVQHSARQQAPTKMPGLLDSKWFVDRSQVARRSQSGSSQTFLILLADPIFQFSACLPHVWRLSLVRIIGPLGHLVGILGNSAAPTFRGLAGHAREPKNSEV